jgi:hypothetical protein
VFGVSGSSFGVVAYFFWLPYEENEQGMDGMSEPGMLVLDV